MVLLPSSGQEQASWSWSFLPYTCFLFPYFTFDIDLKNAQLDLSNFLEILMQS
jgi:hypothetical protein